MLLNRALGTLAMAAVVVIPAQAAERYPAKPIRIIVNSSPGALLDTTTRAVAQKMSEHLGQPFVVENVSGAGGLLGAQRVKRAPPDGYTLLAASGTLALATAFRSAPGYALKDFAPISAMTQSPYVMMGAASLPYKSLSELLVQAKAKPHGLEYASGGIGTTPHMAAAMLLSQAKVDMVHVPYRGNAAAVPDLLAGRVVFLMDGPTTAFQHARDGRARIFGVTSAKRSPHFPDVPTIAEQGLPNYSYINYNGLVAPAGTPKEIVQRLNEAMRAALTSDALRERFRQEGQDPWPMEPAAFAELLSKDARDTAKVMAELGIPRE
jgi:tripartite-type tricarboxylate transporter receptor subunit TctC